MQPFDGVGSHGEPVAAHDQPYLRETLKEARADLLGHASRDHGKRAGHAAGFIFDAPKRGIDFCSGLSRTEQVLRMTTSAFSRGDSTNPRRCRDLASQNESLTFIWQPNVMIWKVPCAIGRCSMCRGKRGNVEGFGKE